MLFLAAFVAILVAVALAVRSRRVTTIYPPTVGLLYRDGRFQRELPPGRYARLDPFGRTRIAKVSLAELPAQIGEITVLSKDQFSFRIGLAPVLKVVDARLYAESQAAVEETQWTQLLPQAASHVALHALVAAAATEAVAGHSLTEIFADQLGVAAQVRAKLDGAIPGAAVERVLLTSLTLPPETRRMFTDVERARMEAQAALERARGEQGALRVLANAARLMSDNPALANLRLLQTLETAKGPTTIVIGNAGGLTGLPVQAAPPSSG